MDTLYFSMLSIASFFIMIFIVVGFHEFGHYITARILGIKVLKFSIGMGKKLISYKSKKSGIIYQISALPIGGFVQMLDEKSMTKKEINKYNDSVLKKSFNRAPLWKRFLVVFNGPFFNLILAIVFLFIVNMQGTIELKPIVGNIKENSWSQNAGIQKGDKIVEVDGRSVENLYKFSMAIIEASGNDLINLKVERKNKIVSLSYSAKELTLERGEKDIISKIGIIPPHLNYDNRVGSVVDGGHAHSHDIQYGDRILLINDNHIDSFYDIKNAIDNAENKAKIVFESKGLIKSIDIKFDEVKSLGIYAYPVEINEDWYIESKLGFYGSIEKAIDTSFYMVDITFTFLKKMITGDISPKLISGPVTMADAAGQSASNGLISFLTFCAVISINLMIINLLPIPGLDGGHLSFYLYAMIFGNEINDNIQNFALKIGAMLILSLMAFAIFMDISDFFL